MDLQINYLAVIVAAIANMAIGFLWYSPLILGKQWMALMGHTKETMQVDQKKMSKYYAISFVVAILTSYVLAHVMGLSEAFYGYSGVQTGIMSAFWMWLGFVMPVQLTGEIFGGKKWKLFAINTGYQLASMLVMGIIIGLIAG